MRIDGLTDSEENELAIYNSERARGLVHSAEHMQRMAQLQARFDAPRIEQQRRNQAAHDERVKKYAERHPSRGN